MKNMSIPYIILDNGREESHPQTRNVAGFPTLTLFAYK